MPNFYVNTYRPLVVSKAGRDAACKHNLPPFVDASIRREPDLEHEYASISCLCRAGKFAPRLRVDDVVAYLTTKGTYSAGRGRHRRLTAILRIQRVLDSHEAAADWYRSQGLQLPSNCMVKGNPAKPLSQTYRADLGRRGCGGNVICGGWDREYRARARSYPAFLVCEPLFRKLSWKAPIVEDADLVSVFGEVPATQNPGRWTMTHLDRLISKLSIRVRRYAR